MSYVRVLPRDLFNEANFLKCLGALWIALENNATATFSKDTVDAFELDQDVDGWLTIANVELVVCGENYTFHRPLNSRAPWPLQIRAKDGWDYIDVFNDDGSLAREFIDLLDGASDQAEQPQRA